MKKILIAEDDAFLLQAYKAKFEKAGFECVFAQDGNEVFTKLGEFTPDVILLDLIMPLKDGFVVLEEMQSTQWKGIPVIVTSNLEQKEDMERCKQLGATDFIVKSNASLDDIVAKADSYVHIS